MYCSSNTVMVLCGRQEGGPQRRMLDMRINNKTQLYSSTTNWAYTDRHKHMVTTERGFHIFAFKQCIILG